MTVIIVVCLLAACVGLALMFMRRPAAPPSRPVKSVDFAVTASAGTARTTDNQTLGATTPHQTPPVQAQGPSMASQVAAAGNETDPQPAVAAPVICPELEAFVLVPAEKVDAELRDELSRELNDLPRPPRALHQLVSLEFVARSSSNELGELVMSEPLVAVKVLSKVNSPLYGVRSPITKIGQAITFLGLQSVRNVCLRYLLDESFKASDPAMKQVFEEIGDASAIASELCNRLSKQVEIKDPSTLMTTIVLSFTGHLAAALIECRRASAEARVPTTSLLQRLIEQQAHIGLAAPEIGRMLMSMWHLPEEFVRDVAAIDHALLAPRPAANEEARTRQATHAVGYLCARLGERLAAGQIQGEEELEAALDADPDFIHLQGHMGPELFAAVRRAMRAPAFFESVRRGQTAEAVADAAMA